VTVSYCRGHEFDTDRGPIANNLEQVDNLLFSGQLDLLSSLGW